MTATTISPGLFEKLVQRHPNPQVEADENWQYLKWGAAEFRAPLRYFYGGAA